MAAGITGVTVDVTCGTTAGLNYRVDGSREEKEGKVLAG
jgi:3-oxoacyl-[acyl-carrier protein] reductase